MTSIPQMWQNHSMSPEAPNLRDQNVIFQSKRGLWLHTDTNLQVAVQGPSLINIIPWLPKAETS